VRRYVRRSKTDRADAAALIEAARCSEIRPVPVKTLEQQQVLGLHRLRAQWMSTRHRYLNTLRGLLREFGVALPQGAHSGRAQIARQLRQPSQDLPAALRPLLSEMLADLDQLEQRVEQVERQSASVASARTQRDCTEVLDHRTTTALAYFSALSMAASNASPERSEASHQTVNPLRSKLFANRLAVERSAWQYDRKMSCK
jgi:transposase